MHKIYYTHKFNTASLPDPSIDVKKILSEPLPTTSTHPDVTSKVTTRQYDMDESFGSSIDLDAIETLERQHFTFDQKACKVESPVERKSQLSFIKLRKIVTVYVCNHKLYN